LPPRVHTAPPKAETTIAHNIRPNMHPIHPANIQQALNPIPLQQQPIQLAPQNMQPNMQNMPPKGPMGMMPHANMHPRPMPYPMMPMPMGRPNQDGVPMPNVFIPLLYFNSFIINTCQMRIHTLLVLFQLLK
jgi:hypothetical protein